MARRVQKSVITDHLVPAFADEDVLCATAFVGPYSFTLGLPNTGPVDLGRGEDADVQLVSGGVSRAHARLVMRGLQAAVEDLGSRNGTFVNRARVNDACTIVAHGDEIAIGDARLCVLRRTALPAGVVPVLVRSAFVARLDADFARDIRPSVFAVQLPDRWYEIAAVRDLLVKLSGVAVAGRYDDFTLLFATRVARGDALIMLANTTRTLRLAGVDTTAGMAPETKGDGAALVDAALKSMLSSHEEDGAPEQPIVVDPVMQRLYEEARRVAPSPITVLIVGETGSGKEIFARTIHKESGRTGPLICVNSAALPEQLLESELFGHEKGAFSGAATAKAGLIEAAQGGTLFLDEIGELPMTMQAKLLRVLEDRVVRRVGATSERKVDVRVVAATNCDLEQYVAERRFRQDLLFRLNACMLHIPPLRARVGEIRRLAEGLLTRAAAGLGAPQLRFTPEAVSALERHSWPGNVRELRNVVERAAALCAPSGEPIAVEHFPAAVRDGTRSFRSAPPPADAVRDSVRDFERQRIVDALQRAGGNQTQAADALGLPRRTLAYKMARLGIRAR